MAQTQEGLKLDEVEDCLLFFADLLHENPVVWNKTDNRYMNNNLKGKAFKEMDDKMARAGHTTRRNLF